MLVKTQTDELLPMSRQMLDCVVMLQADITRRQ